ncbi:MAG: SRPBCC family protein [Xanthobacteraceae bacterium]
MTALNSIELDSDPRSIIGVREFDAPRDLVFAAFTDPRHLSQWWGPNGFTTSTLSFDMRPGGVWRFVMHGPDGRDYQNRVTYEEIVPPQRLVYRHGDDVEPVQFRQTIVFEDLGGRTRITWRGDFPTAAERDRVISEYGADKGLAETLARLAEYVRAKAAQQVTWRD